MYSHWQQKASRGCADIILLASHQLGPPPLTSLPLGLLALLPASLALLPLLLPLALRSLSLTSLLPDPDPAYSESHGLDAA